MTFTQIHNETDFNELFSSKDFRNDIFMNTNQSVSSTSEQILNTLDIPSSSNDQSKNEQIYFKNNSSTKIIFKQSQLPPYLNYAFIFHRTNLQAEYNRKRAIKSSQFGSNCKIDFVKSLSQLSNENEFNENWNIVVKKIPENVTENDLKKLFFNSNQIKYIPARNVQKSNTNQKILLGYAFLSFTNTEQVDEVMNNAYQYQINNQPLILSYYSKIES
ncbi:unnamed protein product [Adineta steineri]|uniref:RRM domain-containing protein n=1 Tax=Adineta steineri TaxID=433720 RepID=A0A816EBT5_9BILA|nr:unnamed protein product [Adineta steineri]CAF1645692.1 unnamed protein product [Adineta steineri]